eukprot:12928261-Prorocentrum_lima.AAC.1
MPSAGRSPSQSIGQLTYMIENTRNVVERLVLEEQAHARKAQQVSAVEASGLRNQLLLLEQQQGHAVDAQQQLLNERT